MTDEVSNFTFLTMTPISPNKAVYLTYLQVVFFASFILYAGQVLFIPLFFGLLLAIILYPTCRWLEAGKWPRGLAITACLLLVFVLSLGLVGLMLWQIAAFRGEFPTLLGKVTLLLKDIQQWVVMQLGISLEEQMNWLHDSLANLGNSIGGLLVVTVNLTVNLLFFLIMVPLFTVLFLYYRRLLVRFLYEYFGKQYQARMQDILNKTVLTYHNYVKGLVFIYLIVGLLNSLGLLFLGIEHAFLFGFMASVLTIIPYVGITMGALLPVAVAWLTYDSIWYPLGVIGIFSFVQYLEANLIFPLVVGTQLRVNMMASLVALLAGGALWGISGVILFLPFVAILKVIADYVTEWKALRILLSPMDEVDQPTAPLRFKARHS